MTLEEKKKIKELVLEVMETEKSFLSDIISEVVNEKLQEKEREEKIKSIVKRDFTRFKETFKALS
jgi:hypothetical protein